MTKAWERSWIAPWIAMRATKNIRPWLAARVAAKFALWLAIWGVAALPVILGAAPAVAAGLTPADRAEVARIEAYLNGINTLQARFIQRVGDDGGLVRGAIHLARPGRLRVEYDPPANYLLIASGGRTVLYDLELSTRSEVPTAATPLAFLLAETVSLEGDITLAAVARDAERGLVGVTLRQTEDVEAGSVALTFRSQPLELLRLELTDAEGVVIALGLFDIVAGGAVAADLFRFVPGESFQERKQR